MKEKLKDLLNILVDYLKEANDTEKLNALANILTEFDLINIETKLTDNEANKFEALQISTQQYLTSSEDFELIRDMFALDIANIKGLCSNFLGTYNDIDMAHSNKKKTFDGKEHIFFRAERPNNIGGFDFVEIILPENRAYLAYGFSDSELIWIRDYLENNMNKIMD